MRPLTWHPDTANAVWTTSSLANVSVFFNFKGVTSTLPLRRSWAALLWDAAQLMSVGVNYLREHIISDARIHYAYRDVEALPPMWYRATAGSTTLSALPSPGRFRSYPQAVIDVAEGAAKMTGTEMTYELYAGLSDFIPNDVLSEVLYEALEEVGGPEFDEADFALAKRFFTENGHSR